MTSTITKEHKAGLRLIIESWNPWLTGSYQTCGRSTVIIREGTVDSVALSIRLGYGMDNRRSIPGRGNRFFSSPERPDPLWGPPRLLTNGNRGPLPQRSETGHSPPSGAVVKNGGATYTSTLYMCLYGTVLNCIITFFFLP